jgi:hypothetical protein
VATSSTCRGKPALARRITRAHVALDGDDSVDQAIGRAKPVGLGEDRESPAAVQRLGVAHPTQAFGVIPERYEVLARVRHVVERIVGSGVLVWGRTATGTSEYNPPACRQWLSYQAGRSVRAEECRHPPAVRRSRLKAAILIAATLHVLGGFFGLQSLSGRSRSWRCAVSCCRAW